MKISFVELEKSEEVFFRRKFPGQELLFNQQLLSEKNISAFGQTEVLSTFIYSALTEKILSALPSLKLVCTRSTGSDHIDLKYCQKAGVTVCNVPSYGVNTVAEHAFALILSLSRRLMQSIEQTRRGDFNLTGLTGFELAGKTLGVIGFGRIGRRVAELGSAFGMRVIVRDINSNNNQSAKTTGLLVDLETLLKESDIVTLHVPLNSGTFHLINKQNISKFKKGAILINTARGAVVETEALVLAIEKGIISGAGLDVLEEECSLKEEKELLTKEFLKSCNLKTQLLNHILLAQKNVLITPHNAFNSREALQEILTVTATNIDKFLIGRPVNVVNL